MFFPGQVNFRVEAGAHAPFKLPPALINDLASFNISDLGLREKFASH
jgi:hypothetical protein